MFNFDWFHDGLFSRSDIDAILDEIVSKEPLVTANRTLQVRQLIERLQQKIGLNEEHTFYLFKVNFLEDLEMSVTEVGMLLFRSSCDTGVFFVHYYIATSSTS